MDSVQKTVSSNVFEGLSFKKILGDGHCLFNAVGLYLGQDALRLRQSVASYINDHVDVFRPFRPGTDKEFTDHIEAIRNGEEWADHIEIEAIQCVTKRPIIIIRPDANPTIPDNINGYYREPIFIYYNGSDHYDTFVVRSGFDSRECLRNIQSLIQQGEDLRFNPMTQFSQHSRDMYQLNLDDIDQEDSAGQECPIPGINAASYSTLSSNTQNGPPEVFQQRDYYSENLKKQITDYNKHDSARNKNILLVIRIDFLILQLNALHKINIIVNNDDYAANRDKEFITEQSDRFNEQIKILHIFYTQQIRPTKPNTTIEMLLSGIESMQTPPRHTIRVEPLTPPNHKDIEESGRSKKLKYLSWSLMCMGITTGVVGSGLAYTGKRAAQKATEDIAFHSNTLQNLASSGYYGDGTCHFTELGIPSEVLNQYNAAIEAAVKAKDAAIELVAKETTRSMAGYGLMAGGAVSSTTGYVADRLTKKQDQSITLETKTSKKHN